MESENVVVKPNCHSRESLSGIFPILSRCSNLKEGNTLYDNNKEMGNPRQKPSGMTPNFKEEALNKGSFRAPLRFGFTLIELLVVVLIIGILAAIAVPQYQVVRDKAEVVRALPVLKAFKNMQELYRMANGEYATSLYDLDIDQLGDCSVISATVMLCGPHRGRCIMNGPNSSLEYPLQGGASLQQYYAKASNGRQNWVRCGGGTTARVKRLCKALGADENTQSTNTNGTVYWRVPL